MCACNIHIKSKQKQDFFTHYLCPLITDNWLEEVLPVGQRVQASGFWHSQQDTKRKELAQHAQTLLVPAENKTSSYIQQWKDIIHRTAVLWDLNLPFYIYWALFIHLSLCNSDHYRATTMMNCNDKHLQIKPQVFRKHEALQWLTAESTKLQRWGVVK